MGKIWMAIACAVALCSCATNVTEMEGRAVSGKGDCATCETDGTATTFLCHTVRPHEGETAAFTFAVTNLHDENAVDIVWPSEEEEADGIGPVRSTPWNAPTRTLGSGIYNGGLYLENGRLIIEADDDGVDYGTLVLFENSGYERGYFRFEHRGVYAFRYYSPVWCDLDEAPESPNDQ